MDEWTRLPWWIRTPIALGFIVAGLVLLLTPTNTLPPLWTSGFLIAIGIVLLLWEPSDAEKKGYHF